MSIGLSTTLSPQQLVTLWSELEQCYYGDNPYGGDTAEIHAYTLLPSSPLREKGQDSAFAMLTPEINEAVSKSAAQAAEALAAALNWFCHVRECSAEVDGESLDENPLEAFLDRVHVKILRSGGTSKEEEY